MKLITVIICIILLFQFSYGQVKYKHISIALSQNIDVSSFLVKDAEFITAELSIQNDDSDPIKRYELMTKAKKSLEAIIKYKDYLSIILLPVNLTTTRGKFVSSFIYNTSLNYRILISLSHFKNDFLEATSQLRKVVDSLPEIEDTDYELSNAELAIENPELYRQEIIDIIVQDLDNMKKSFGDSINFEIDGLENPVQAVQLDDIKVALYIGHKIKLKK